ncbi:hypothetical protein ACWGIU_28810 [Streptomyces sp. NPDC054840]
MSSVEEFRTGGPGAATCAHPAGALAALKACGGPGREPEARTERPAAGAHEDPYGPGGRQRFFLLSRADTVHAGSDESRRTLIAERILGLPQEVRA